MASLSEFSVPVFKSFQQEDLILGVQKGVFLIVFLIFAIIATPKLTIPALIIYGANLIPALVYRQNEIPTIGIHVLNCTWIVAFIEFVVLRKSKTLQLTDNERSVLSQLAEGKLQKEVEPFTQNQVTQILKNAMSRNMCKTKAELLNRFIKENHKAP